MSAPIPDIPEIPIPKTKEEANTSLFEIQSAEQGYYTICLTALDTIKSFMDNPSLTTRDREELIRLLPKIQTQRDRIVALASQAQDTLDNSNEETYDAETIAAYEETVNAFTATTEELNKHLDLMMNLVQLNT